MEENLFDISKLVCEPSIRFDVDYIKNDLNKINFNYVKFTDLFEITNKNLINYDEIESPIKYCQIGDVDNKNNKNFKLIDFDNEIPQYADYYKKIKNGDIFLPKKGEILISKVRPYLKKILFIQEEDIYYTTAFISLKPKYNPLLSYYFLYFTLTQDIDIVSRQGKGYPTLKEDDLIYLKISKKDFNNLLKISNSIEKMKDLNKSFDNINKLKSNLVNEDSIIETIIINELGINLNKFYKSRENRNYIIDASEMVDNIDIRCSTKFNRPSKKLLYEIQNKNNFIQMKSILKKDGELGKSISPSDFTDDNTGNYYISMADISSYRLDYENLKQINSEYYNANKSKSVNKNDILITRSGEGGIGKVAIIEDDISAIFCDFIIRLSINKNYYPKFLYYYMRTVFFQYFVETNKKGLGNNTNIFPNQIQYALIPNIKIEKQKEICSVIKNLIDNNNKHLKKIDSEMLKIKKIMLN